MDGNCLGVPPGLILVPLLFNIFLADLFFIVNSMDILNYGDSNTACATANDIIDAKVHRIKCR